MTDTVGSSLKSAVKGTTLLFMGSAVSMLLWFVIRIIIIRSVSPKEFGIYALTLSVEGILVTISYLGLPQGITRQVAVHLGHGEGDEAQAVSRTALHIGFLSSILMSGALFALSGFAARHVFYMPELTMTFRVVAFAIPFTVLSGIYTNILRGRGLMRPRVFFQDIGQPLFYLLLIGLLYQTGLSSVKLLWAFVLAAAFMLVSNGAYSRLKTGLVLFAQGRHYRELILFSVPLMVVGISAILLKWTDTLMLGRYGDAADVGIYNTAVSLAQLMLFFWSALNFVFLPLAGELHGRQQTAELKRSYQVLTKWIFSVTLPIFFVLFLFPEMVITFLFGEAFLGGALPLRLLSLGFLLHTFLGTNGMLLTAIGYPKAIMRISVAGGALNIVLNYIFLKPMGLGVFGAALATMISYMLINLALSITLYRLSGIHPLTSRYLKPTGSSVVVGMAVYALAKGFPLYFWMMPLYLLLFIAGYLFSLLVTKSIDTEDVYILETILDRVGVRLEKIRQLLRRQIDS